MPRGGGKKSHKGNVRRFTNPEEIERQMKEGPSKPEEKPKDDISEDEEDEESSSGEEGGDQKRCGVQGLIEIENPNRAPAKTKKLTQNLDTENPAKPQLSRREREAIQAENARREYERLHAAGLTEQAQADLARLALVRKQREEAAKKREEEKNAKEAEKAARQAHAFKKLDKKESKKGSKQPTKAAPGNPSSSSISAKKPVETFDEGDI